MSRVIVDDPDFHRQRKADDRGRVFLGSEFAGEELTIIVERVENESD